MSEMRRLGICARGVARISALVSRAPIAATRTCARVCIYGTSGGSDRLDGQAPYGAALAQAAGSEVAPTLLAAQSGRAAGAGIQGRMGGMSPYRSPAPRPPLSLWCRIGLHAWVLG